VSQQTVRSSESLHTKGSAMPRLQILRTAETDDIIPRSPCIGIDLPRETSHQEKRFLTAAEVARLAGEIEDRYGSLIFAAAYTGLRWGELAALKVERVNLLRGTVEVTEAIAEIGGRLYLGPRRQGQDGPSAFQGS